MKAPQEVRELVAENLQTLDREITERESLIATYEALVSENQKSLKSLQQKRKELTRFAKKIGLTEQELTPSRFVPWDGNLPDSLSDEKRNEELAGILTNGEANV